MQHVTNDHEPLTVSPHYMGVAADLPARLIRSYGLAKDAIYRILNSFFGSGALTADEAGFLHGHALMSALHERGLIRYDAKFSVEHGRLIERFRDIFDLLVRAAKTAI